VQSKSDCPDPKSIEQFLIGLLDGPEAARVEEHLLNCPQCATMAADERSSDTFVDALRACKEVDIQVPPAVDRVMRESLQLPSVISKLSSNRLDTSAATELNSASQATNGVITKALAIFAPPAQPGDLGSFGSYRVIAVLGIGGMGIVFKAEDMRLRRLLALKLMAPSLAADAEAKQRFLREGRGSIASTRTHCHDLRGRRGRRATLSGDGVTSRRKPRSCLPARSAGASAGDYPHWTRDL
jgi:anti-sigma factor RsiW